MDPIQFSLYNFCLRNKKLNRVLLLIIDLLTSDPLKPGGPRGQTTSHDGFVILNGVNGRVGTYG